MLKNVVESGIITSGLAFAIVIFMIFIHSASAAGGPVILNITAVPDITDLTDPVLNATVSDTLYNITNATFYIGGNDSNSFNLDPVDGAFDSKFENVTGTINISNLTEGVYNITISAWNTNGDRNDSNGSGFIVDKTPPIVWLNNPANRSYIHQNISIEFSVYDISPVTASYSIKSPLANFTNQTGIPLDAGFKINTTGWNESEYDITVVIKDSLGRTNSTDIIRIYIDNTCPNLTIIEPDTVYATTLNSITIYGNTDGDANLTFNDLPLSHTNGAFSIDRSLVLGPNIFYINASDNASNTNSSVLVITRYLLVKAKTEGSGGGAGGTGEDFNNIAETQTQRTSIFKDEHVSFKFERTQNPIIYINFTAKASAGLVASKIEVLRNTSTMVDKAVPGVVYKNVNIWVGNLGWANEKSISNATIIFHVPRDWIRSRQLNEENISLFRFSGVSWSQLPTYIIGGDAKYIYYASRTPSFSPFAISGSLPPGRNTITQPGGIVIATPTVKSPVTETKNEAQNITSIVVPLNSKGQNKTVRTWVVFIVCILCAVSSIYPRKNEILTKFNNIRLQHWR